jgi:hypothetical protein
MPMSDCGRIQLHLPGAQVLQRNLAVVLVVAGRERAIRPASLRHRLGLMFFPWLAESGHSVVGMVGGWALMENMPHPVTYAANYRPVSGEDAWFVSFDDAQAAMTQFNAMAAADRFRVRVPAAAVAA